jgi:signal transduction histidine kinase
MGKRKYIPNKKTNPIVQARKLDKLGEDVDRHGKALDMVIKSYDSHVEHLSNFAQHDMKNAIQSMDSVLYTTDFEAITEEEWMSLKTCLKNIRDTFENFSKLAPHSKTKTFTIDKLIIALEILTKYELTGENINATFNYPKQSEIEMFLPFQSILQMLHNIIINAMKSLETKETKQIELNAVVDENQCLIEIFDSGVEISKDIIDKIFDYGYTQTGGTGIGLYHAKYVCEKINGSILVYLNPSPIFTKKFSITIPLKLLTNES